MAMKISTLIPFPACVSRFEHLHVGLGASGTSRRLLMSFGGSLAGHEESVRLRTQLWSACQAYGEPLCAGLTSPHEGAAFFPPDKLAAAFVTKKASTFCLEPGGFAVIRKAILDALALGCIPVLFLEENELNHLWRVHWGSWRNDSSINVPRRAYLRGEIDLL